VFCRCDGDHGGATKKTDRRRQSDIFPFILLFREAIIEDRKTDRQRFSTFYEIGGSIKGIISLCLRLSVCVALTHRPNTLIFHTNPTMAHFACKTDTFRVTLVLSSKHPFGAQNVSLSPRDLAAYEDLRSQFVTGQGSQVRRVPFHDPAASPLWRSLHDNPHPRISKLSSPLSTETFSFTGEGIGFFGTRQLPALAPTVRVIEIADWFAEPEHTIVDMGSYRRLQQLKLHAEERVYGYVKGWSPPKDERHPPSPFGPPEHRFRPFNPLPEFEQSCGFIHFVGR
jgi:hypothetical protein